MQEELEVSISMQANSDNGSVRMQLNITESDPWTKQMEVFFNFLKAQGYELDMDDFTYRDKSLTAHIYGL